MVAVLKADPLELRAPSHKGLPYRSKSLGGRWKGAEVR